MDEAFKLLKQYWGYDTFRPIQEEIVAAVLKGEDVLAILPTGGGKSLCFQLPGLVKEGLCIVVSPLIALMEDQCHQLKSRGISAVAVHSGMNAKRIRETMEYAQSGSLQFLYVAPERLVSSRFKEYLWGMNINFVAIDEAHCISQWGMDFRPPYRRIAELKTELPGVQFVALTASASREVQQDIVNSLQLERPQIFRRGTARPNLSYRVAPVPDKLQALRLLLQGVRETVIVYTQSRSDCERLFHHLGDHGYSSSFYHAGMDSKSRSRVLTRFLKGQISVIFATSAFGMGIDKSDIRRVIHWDLPMSLEDYYQEAGRAGRDGKPAEVIALLDERSITRLIERFDRQYPSFGTIRSFWASLYRYADRQGTDSFGAIKDLELKDLAAEADLPFGQMQAILNHLHRLEWIRFLPKGVIRSKVKVILSKDQLYEYTDTVPELSPILSQLLRGLEGVFFGYVSFNESDIAKTLNVPLANVQRDLQRLHSHGVISYSRSSGSQTITLLNKPKLNRDSFAPYLKLKETRRLQLKAFIEYIETTDCRSQFIQRYFGDQLSAPCGRCDNTEKNDFHEKLSSWYENQQSFRLSEALSLADGMQRLVVKDFLKAEMEAGRVSIVDGVATKTRS